MRLIQTGYSDNYLQNRIDRLYEELMATDMDYTDPILVALINYHKELLDTCEPSISQERIYSLLNEALYWYREGIE